MYLTTSPARISDGLQRLATEGAALHRRALSEPMTARDLALAVELNQRYVDLLTELEDAEFDISSPAASVEANETRLKFDDIDGLADWLVEIMP